MRFFRSPNSPAGMPRFLPSDAIAITFDDGYTCTANVAAPLLDRLALPSTVFLPAGLIERRREFWWDDLERIVRNAHGPQLRVDGVAIDIGSRCEGDGRWASYDRPKTKRQRAYRSLWKQLEKLSDDAREGIVANLRRQAGLDARPRDSHRMVTPAEVRSLRETRMSVGSHGLTHSDLPRLSANGKQAEIIGSITRCVELTGEMPSTFAYPHGRTDKATIDMVAGAGFEAACTTEPKSIGSRDHRLALPRLAIGNWDLATFQRMIAS